MAVDESLRGDSPAGAFSVLRNEVIYVPRKPKHPCGYPGCPNLVESGERYCAEHEKLAAKQYSNDKYRRIIWQCNAKFKDKKRCATPHLTEDEMKETFVRIVNKVITDRDFYITELKAILKKLSDTGELEKEKRILDQQLSVDAKAVNDLIARNARVAINQSEYKEQYAALAARYEETERRRGEVMARINEKMVRARKIERFIKTLPEEFTEFDAGLWAALIDSVTVNSKDDIVFHLSCGMDVKA